MGHCLVSKVWRLFLGTLESTQPCGNSQMCHKRRGKKWPRRLNKIQKSNIVLLFSDWNTCWDALDHVNLRPISFRETCFGFSPKNFFSHLYRVILWSFSTCIYEKKGLGIMFMAEQDRKATFHSTKKNVACKYVIYHISNSFFNIFFFFFFWELLK